MTFSYKQLSFCSYSCVFKQTLISLFSWIKSSFFVLLLMNMFISFVFLLFLNILFIQSMLREEWTSVLSINIEICMFLSFVAIFLYKMGVSLVDLLKVIIKPKWFFFNFIFLGVADTKTIVFGKFYQTFLNKNAGSVVHEQIELTQDWCFFARTLAGIDPFDVSRWSTDLTLSQQVELKDYVCAPEFYSYSWEWVQKISEFNVTDNFLFLWDIDGLTRLFVLLKVFGRYGSYLPEFVFFVWLVYLLIVTEDTSKTFNRLVTTIQLCIFTALATILLPFSPAELFTGYKTDGYGELVKVIFLILVLFYFSSISIWQLYGSVKKEMYIITLFFLFFSLVMISCSNLWIFFFALEGISFCTIIFFVFNFSGQGHISDAVRYFCLNAVASGALLLSLGLGEYVTNTADYNEFANFFLLNSNIVTVPNSFSLAVILFSIGSLFKLGIFPFNIYEVDTYKKASYIVIYFSSIITKVPFFFVWLKLVWRVIPFIKIIFPFLFVFGLLTAVIGTIAASFQTGLRPFLTYSSMGHIGLILMSFTTETLLGVNSACLYFLTYIIAMSIIYMTLNALEGAELDMHGVHQLRELRAKFSVACCFTIGILALAGFPLTIGFFAKIGLLINLAAMGQVWIVILVLLLNLISFGYYLRVLKIIWVEVNNVAALKYTLTDMAKVRKIGLERTFFAVQVLSTILVLFAIFFIFSFKFIIILTGTLLCVAVYSVDWWFFIRTGLAGLKTWLFFSLDRDFNLAKLVQEWDKIKFPTPHPSSWRGKTIIKWLWPEPERATELFKRYGIDTDQVRIDSRSKKLLRELATLRSQEDRIGDLYETYFATLKQMEDKGMSFLIHKNPADAIEADAFRAKALDLSDQIRRAREQILAQTEICKERSQERQKLLDAYYAKKSAKN